MGDKRRSRTRNFTNEASYDRWLAFDKMHVHPGPSAHPLNIEIGGKAHKVKHGYCSNGCGRPAIHHHDANACCGHCCGPIMASEAINGTGFDTGGLDIGFDAGLGGLGFDSGL